jgi:MFS family permease
MLYCASLSSSITQIFQGVAPSFVGGFADSAGRRPAYTIGFVVDIAANIGLALKNNYAALTVLRCMQSAGSSGMVTIATAVIADIVTSAERGSYFGWTSVGSVLGPFLSPIIGGLLAQYMGWHSIFWFLAIFAGLLFIPFRAFFPETCRKIVDDGSVPPPPWNKSLTYFLHERKLTRSGQPPDYTRRDALTSNRRVSFPNPLATLRIVASKEQALLLTYAGIVYAGYYAIAATITTQFAAIYHLHALDLGLCFIPISIGTLLAAVGNGKYDPIDGNYRRHARKLNLPTTCNRHTDLSQFPIERARLEIVAPCIAISALTTVAYGWVLAAAAPLTAPLVPPLVLLFLLGFFLAGSFKCFTILNVDIAPRGRPAAASAAFNLVRCLLGAAATALVDPALRAMGRGGTFTLVGASWVVLMPMLWVVARRGVRWRGEGGTEEGEGQVGGESGGGPSSPSPPSPSPEGDGEHEDGGRDNTAIQWVENVYIDIDLDE